MKWRKMVGKHDGLVPETEGLVVARYWYVQATGNDVGAEVILVSTGYTKSKNGIAYTAEMVYPERAKEFRRKRGYRYTSLSDVRRAKKGMWQKTGVRSVKSVLVTVRMVPKGGPKTVPSQKLPSTFPGVTDDQPSKAYTNEDLPKLQARFGDPDGVV